MKQLDKQADKEKEKEKGSPSSPLTTLAAELRASTEKLQHLNSALELFNTVSREAIENSSTRKDHTEQ